jgi:hypothetical protein
MSMAYSGGSRVLILGKRNRWLYTVLVNENVTEDRGLRVVGVIGFPDEIPKTVTQHLGS